MNLDFSLQGPGTFLGTGKCSILALRGKPVLPLLSPPHRGPSQTQPGKDVLYTALGTQISEWGACCIQKPLSPDRGAGNLEIEEIILSLCLLTKRKTGPPSLEDGGTHGLLCGLDTCLEIPPSLLHCGFCCKISESSPPALSATCLWV
jgi:hypothetical protein